MELPLLDHYRTIEHTSQKMLEAAQADDWDQAEKQRILQHILQRDADIRALADPWLQALPSWLEQRREATLSMA